jgi:anti-anti-sigma regulatory factor
VPITLEINEKQGLIGLEGAIDIASAAELKKLLLEALSCGREVRVSLQGATDLDVTAVQLLWAAERAARGAGVDFALSGAAPVLAALGDAGFLGLPGGASGR